MKITKSQLKEIIKEALDEQQLGEPAPQEAPRPDAREKKVNTAATSGAMMGAEQYAGILKQVLLSTKVAPQDRKQALEAIFGPKGAAINSIVLQMLKGAQE
jgi:hypothetical protein